MDRRAIPAALAAGLAAFVLVGVAVTELAASRVEFSVFLGLPAGVTAGVVATLAVLYASGDVNPGHQRVGRALGGFGVGFLAGLVGATVVARTGAVVGLVVGVVAGLAAAVLSWARAG